MHLVVREAIGTQMKKMLVERVCSAATLAIGRTNGRQVFASLPFYLHAEFRQMKFQGLEWSRTSMDNRTACLNGA